MLGFSPRFLGFFSLAFIFLTSCKHVENHYRQAIPLAIVQADTLATAKQPPNADKTNATVNGTQGNSTEKNRENSLLHKSIGLQDASPLATPSKAVWRVDQQSLPNFDSSSNQEATDQKEITAEETKNEAESYEEHPNGNGPQDMKLKGPGGYQSKPESVENKRNSLNTIKRFKRGLDFLDDDDDDDELAEKIALRLTRLSRSHITKPKAKKSEKKGLKRDFIGMPYIPNVRGFGNGYTRSSFDESKIMEDEMSSIPSSQPVGMASDFQPSDFDPMEDADRRSMYPSNKDSPAPDPVRLQEMYERSSSWEPVGTRSRFSAQDEYNYGLPDANYERSIEDDAQTVDDRFVRNYFNQEKRNSRIDQGNERKENDENRLALLDSLGIGQSEIDHRYLAEAKNIQEYLARSEEQNAGRSLGHDSRQHNSIQLGLSPELMRENPNVWNMLDSASYTPMSQEAESLLPNRENNDGQVLQSQNSMGRVFVPMNLENLAQGVRDEIRHHYALPKLPAPYSGTNSDKAVPNFPDIVKSFYPNIPYQTVRGASFNPPDMSNMRYRSMINRPFGQQSPNLQSFMQPSYQPMPIMMPFSGIPFQNMLRGHPFWGPVPLMSGGFPGPMMASGPEGNQDMASERQDVERKGPGTLTVKSTEDGDDAKEQNPKSSDFEELLTKDDHKTVQRVNVQGRPKNDSLMYLKEAVPSDLASMKTAIKEVLDSSVLAGNISTAQSKAISDELTTAFIAKEQNKTLANITANDDADLNKKVIDEMNILKSNVARAESKCKDKMVDCKRFKDAGICPFVGAFMNGACAKTCDSCSPKTKSRIQELLDKKKAPALDFTASNGPSMYLDFDNATASNLIKDKSGNDNDAVMLKGAKISSRKLGTCGRGAELNDGDISWDGKTFHKKPVDAVTLAMWVKVHKGGTINWFASGDKGTTFYTSTKDATIPAKIWTHVTGSYDSAAGLSSIYINGALIKQTKQKKGQKLVQDWLVNGIGRSFGDDSMHYVDELYVFNRALKPVEVQALYDKCTFNRMVIHYGFQKGNNTLMLDQSGLQNDAIPIGGAAQKEDCERCGACLDLTHGPNPTLKVERISLSHIPIRSVSIALWVSLNSTKGVHDVFITQGPLDGSGYRLRIIDGKIRWSVGTDSGETIFDYETRSVTVPETLWTHVIATYDKETGDVAIYANGVQKFKDTVDKKERKLLPRDWETEAKLGDKSFDGFMDEFIMYNWAIDESEASYIRNYCADHPKLVRFIVRVPLTKRDKVLKGAVNVAKNVTTSNRKS